VYADTILLIRQDTLPKGQKSGVSTIIIDKRRYGPTGVVKLAWFPNQGRFEDRELAE
jgi:replicative DNA helicase